MDKKDIHIQVTPFAKTSSNIFKMWLVNCLHREGRSIAIYIASKTLRWILSLALCRIEKQSSSWLVLLLFMVSKCSPIAESIAWECPDVCRSFVIITLGTCCLILTSRGWQVLPIYVEIQWHSNLYINIVCWKIGNLSLCVEFKVVLVVKNRLTTAVHRGGNPTNNSWLI